MYSRNLDPRRLNMQVPNHYSGSAFRSDGSPAPIPVTREPDSPKRQKRPLGPSEPSPSPLPEEETPPEALPEIEDEILQPPPPEEDRPEAKADTPTDADTGTGFLSRLSSGLLGSLESEELLLIALILLLSQEQGHEDTLFILAMLLLAG